MLPLTRATKHYMGIKGDDDFLNQITDLKNELQAIYTSLNQVSADIFDEYSIDELDPLDDKTKPALIDSKIYNQNINKTIGDLQKVIDTFDSFPEELGYSSDSKRIGWAVDALSSIPDSSGGYKDVIRPISSALDNIDQIIDSLKTDEIVLSKSNKYQAGDLVVYKNKKYVWKILYVSIVKDTNGGEGVGYMITTPAYSPLLAFEKDIALAPQGSELGDEVQ